MSVSFLLLFAELDSTQAAAIGNDLNRAQRGQEMSPATRAALEGWRAGELGLPLPDRQGAEDFARGFHEPWPEYRWVGEKLVRASSTPTFSEVLLEQNPHFELTEESASLVVTNGYPGLALLAYMLGPSRYGRLPFTRWGFLLPPASLDEACVAAGHAFDIAPPELAAVHKRAESWFRSYDDTDVDELLSIVPTALRGAAQRRTWLLGASIGLG